MPDAKSGKFKADKGEQNSELIQIITSKFNELKQDLITEIKSLIQLEVEKVVKKQKEEFDETVIKLQEPIKKLELEKDDLEQYGRWVCVRTDDVHDESEETAKSIFEKVGNSCRKHVQMYLFLALTEPIALGLNTIHIEIKRNITALLFVHELQASNKLFPK